MNIVVGGEQVDAMEVFHCRQDFHGPESHTHELKQSIVRLTIPVFIPIYVSQPLQGFLYMSLILLPKTAFTGTPTECP
jgi:hypothetical protein